MLVQDSEEQQHSATLYKNVKILCIVSTQTANLGFIQIKKYTYKQKWFTKQQNDVTYNFLTNNNNNSCNGTNVTILFCNL